MATIDPVYTPTPITQRDGSALANSNCRMASIATGVDYQTKGRDRSTGSKMRSYTSDQSGGTDSGDAVEAWRNGYAETLTVRDGYTFDNLLQDLRAGSAVNIDVWHATAGGPCLSGSGAYGHNMFILPDQHSDGTKWRVSDPWCSPGSWAWWPESQLRAGAEEWGRRVYGAAVSDADYPTAGSGLIGDPRHPLALAIVRRIVRLLMDASHPGAEDTTPGPPTPGDWGETGGGKPILYTRTAALGVAGGEAMGVQINGMTAYQGTAVVRGTGHMWIRLWDGHTGGAADGFTKEVYAKAKLAAAFSTGDTTIPVGTPVVLIGDDAAILLVQDVDLTDAPAGDAAEAVAERDEDWREWLLAGSPGGEDG